MQIANSIAARADFGGSVPVTETAAEAAPFASRVQILILQLEPQNLGKVTVKMRLTGAKLELQVEAGAATMSVTAQPLAICGSFSTGGILR